MRVGAVSLLLSLALMLLSSVNVYADANPANHGHHYGQLKHRVTTPLPPPPTTTTPPANTTPPLTTNPPAAGAQTAARAAGTAAEALVPGAGGIASVAAPPVEIQPSLPHFQEATVAKAVVPGDQNLWWLLLILAISLTALWLLAFVQLSRAAIKRRATQAAV